LSDAATDGSNQVEFGLIPVELPGAVYDPYTESTFACPLMAMPIALRTTELFSGDMVVFSTSTTVGPVLEKKYWKSLSLSANVV
jgi:hypothetical protein